MLDIEANRSARKWSVKEYAGRVFWMILFPLFVLSPRPAWWWRRLILRFAGAQIGRDVHIFPNVKIIIPWNLTINDEVAIGDGVNLYALGAIVIGKRATISQGVHLCAGTHDYRHPSMPLLKLPIAIGEDAWICADAFIGPGVVVGTRAIVGARSVAMKNIADDMIVAGNPAREIKRRAPFGARARLD